ncbi:type II toxin-antitoxin system RelE/ParE family toxin [Novosphingobium sp. Chol11]|uniref:type II toxin-antitoxin system RelE/ParE family toxin n=1 Tax=Novosphingobium sp. Chol11 TaxID=1385763 RepID=UPI0025DFC7DA|nr:type II toxin-antitoxin system RelE/ParE family toxin [Novosphingobium sp. Chol11]
MAKIKFSAAARKDLAAIDEYGAAQFGDEIASEYARGFQVVFSLLGQYTLAGRLRSELREGTRCKVHRRHLIFYRFTDDTVFIQRILHHSQDIPAHLRP